MGQGQSVKKEESALQLKSKFTAHELSKLGQYFQIKSEVTAGDENGQEWSYQHVKRRITESFSDEVAGKIINYFNKHEVDQDNHDFVSESFLLLVYHLTKDCIKELAEIVFLIVGQGDEIITRLTMQKFLSEFIEGLLKGALTNQVQFAMDKESCDHVSMKLVEHCPDKLKLDGFDVALHRTPLLIDILQYKFRMVFFDHISEGSKDVQGTMPFLIPDLVGDKSMTDEVFLLTLPMAIYINSNVQMHLQHKWRLLYSSKLHGESYSKFTGAIINKGPTLLSIRDTNGYTFGGFASKNWQYSSQFQGTDRCFLFTAAPSLDVFDCLSASYNNHYMYLNIGQETMPNGLGMGGQFDFFGLWLDQEFGKGHSRAKPKCTTYGSPQLSKDEEFKVEAINVWGLGDEPKKLDEEDYNEEMTSVLDKHVEAKALLEIAGKPRVSEGLRDTEPDADIPGTKELQHPHDPMT